MCSGDSDIDGVIQYDAKVVLLRSPCGLSYIARLLVDPRIPVGTSGPVLDDQALAAYRKIYHEITHDEEEAKRDNDHSRIIELEKQKEAFSAEIEKATGLGGRRREKSDPERGRKNFSNAVTRAIDAVASEHEWLEKHLQNSIT
jgi:hypothetical protein